MQRIVEHLPGLRQARKSQLTSQFTEIDWRPDSDVANAFAAIFPRPRELFRFGKTVKRIVKQMGLLIEDKTVYVSKADAVCCP